MKKIQKISIWDHMLLGIAFYVFFTLMRPYGLKNSVSDDLWALQSLGCCSPATLSSCIVTAPFW